MVLFLVMEFGLLTGLLVELGLAASIILHELGHSLVAIRKGCRVRRITLMVIGGAAQMERIPTRPLDEFLMALAGPMVSLTLGLLGFFGGGRLPLPPVHPYPVNVVQFLGLINLGLTFFNLLPSFPMDGGRVFRALLTPKLGRLRATFVAARLGKIMAICFGLYAFLSTPRKWILVAIAIFVYVMAENEYRHVEMQERGKGRGGFPPCGDDAWGNGANDDKVSISPPPYGRGRKSKSEIRPADEDPF
jgi:Zn-dependent protease